MPDMLGSFQRNAGPWFIYKPSGGYWLVIDTRLTPDASGWWSCVWGTLPLTFNIWQNRGQLKIYFLACEETSVEVVQKIGAHSKGRI